MQDDADLAALVALRRARLRRRRRPRHRFLLGAFLAAGLVAAAVLAGAYLHDFVLGPGLARQIREGKPQSLRPILTAIGRANLLVTLALPVLGALLGEFLRD